MERRLGGLRFPTGDQCRRNSLAFRRNQRLTLCSSGPHQLTLARPLSLGVSPMNYVIAALGLAFFLAQVAPPAQAAESRILGFSTQDQNGLHIITISREREAAVVRTVPGGATEDPPIISYPSTRFDEVWTQLAAIDLSALESTERDRDIDAAVNYVLVVGGIAFRRTYLVPKCGAAPEVEALVASLTEGLLPDGSPGLFHACAISDG